MDTAFKILQRKEIYEFLEGNGDQKLVIYNGQPYGLPYHTRSDLGRICRTFSVTEPLDDSRWKYVDALLRCAIDNNRCDEMFRYLFSLEMFNNLKGISNMKEIKELHERIVVAAVKKINEMIQLTLKELRLINGHFYITDAGTKSIIQTPKVDTLSTNYVRDLRERCENDLTTGNYDSVVTKSRTMMEEVLIQILEQGGEIPRTSGKIIDLYNQVKNIRNMQQRNTFDNRINGLLSGLEKIVQNIGDMRNINNDAHGVGSRRIGIKEKEARLIMNSSITFCEYMLECSL